jgi:hypothetical protein
MLQVRPTKGVVRGPLSVRNGHREDKLECPLYAQKRTLGDTCSMSALGQERTLYAAVRCDILQLANACSQCSWNTSQFHDV